MTEPRPQYTTTSATPMPPDYLRGAHVMTLTDREAELINASRANRDIVLTTMCKVDGRIIALLQKARNESRFTGANMAVVDFKTGAVGVVSVE